MKRITQEEINDYIELPDNGDPFRIRHAVAFTLTPIPDEHGWEKVTYYKSKSSPKFRYISHTQYGTRTRIDYTVKNHKSNEKN
jgi:hypothetical protein